MSDLVNQREMAEILRTTATTVKRMEGEGVITPAYRYRMTVRYDPADVIKQLEDHRDKELTRKRKPRPLSTLVEAARGKW
jgi:hypothetical protein